MPRVVLPNTATREEWLAERMNGIGASDVPTILGLNKWKSPLELWMHKTKKKEDTVASDAAWFGLQIEESLAKLFTRKTGIELTEDQTLFAHSDHDWKRCTPDYFYEEEGVKVPVQLKHTKNAFDGWAEEAPLWAVSQVMWELHVQELPKGIAFALAAGDVNSATPHVIDYEEQFMGTVLPKVEKFWECVKTDIPPEAGPGDAKNISLLMGSRKGVSELDTAAYDAAREMVKAKEELAEANKDQKYAKEKFEMLRNNFLLSLGAVDTVTVQGAKLLSVATVDRKAYSVEASQYERITVSANKKVKELLGL